MRREIDLMRKYARYHAIIAMLIFLVVPLIVARAETCDSPFFVVAGPVDHIDSIQKIIYVAGQAIRFTQAQVPPLESFVRVTYRGVVPIFTPPELYIPGSSEVTITGLIIKVESTRARVLVGNLWIDYTGLLSAYPEIELGVGDHIQSTGVQPLRNGDLMANSVQKHLVQTPTPNAKETNGILPDLKRIGSDVIVGTNGIIGGGRK